MFHDNSYIRETYDENLVKLNFHLRQTAMKGLNTGNISIEPVLSIYYIPSTCLFETK